MNVESAIRRGHANGREPHATRPGVEALSAAIKLDPVVTGCQVCHGVAAIERGGGTRRLVGASRHGTNFDPGHWRSVVGYLAVDEGSVRSYDRCGRWRRVRGVKEWVECDVGTGDALQA